MAAEPTDRFAIYRWTLDTDEFNRDQMDTSHRNIEERGAVLYQGTPTTRDNISVAARARAFFFDTTSQTLSYYDTVNGQWQNINALASTVTAIDGTTGTAGTSEDVARADHRHQLTFNNGVSPSDITTAANVGTATTPARADHTHAVADSTITAPKLAAAVAGEGLSKTSTALNVNTDGSTLEVSADSLRVKAAGLSNTQNVAGYRNLRTGSAAPTEQTGAGDLWVSTSDYQIRQYIGSAWTEQAVLDRRPAVKIQRPVVETLSGDNTNFRVVFTTVLFPSTSPEQTKWFVDGDTAGAYGIRVPYTGFYLIQASTSWQSQNGLGVRKLWTTRQVFSNGAYGSATKLDGGVSANDLAATNDYLEMTMSTFQALNATDLINVYLSHRGGFGGAAVSAGSTLSMTFISPL